MLKQNSIVILLAISCLSLIFIQFPNYVFATGYDVVSPSALSGKQICGVARINNLVGIESPSDSQFYIFNASNYNLVANMAFTHGMSCSNVLTYKNMFIFIADNTIQEVPVTGSNAYIPTGMLNPCIGGSPYTSHLINFAYGTSDNAKDITLTCSSGSIAQVRADNPVLEEYLDHSALYSGGCNVPYSWVHDEQNGYAVVDCLQGGTTGKLLLYNNTAESNSFTFDQLCCNVGTFREWSVVGLSNSGNYYTGFLDGGQIQLIKRSGHALANNGSLPSGGRDYPLMCQTNHAPYSNCGVDLVVSTTQTGHGFQVWSTRNNTQLASINCGVDCPFLSYLGGSTVSNDTFYSTSGSAGSFIIFHGSPFTGAGNNTCNTGLCGTPPPPPPTPGTTGNSTCPTVPVDPITNQGTVLNLFENWWISLNIVSCNNNNPQTNGFGLLFLLAFMILELYFFMLITKGQLEKIHVAFWIIGLFIAIGITTFLGLIEPYWMILLIVVLALFSSYRIWYPILTGKSQSAGISGD